MRALIALALFFTACLSKDDELSEHMKIEHPNGVILVLSKDWSADKTPSGFRVSAQKSQFARYPEEVLVSIKEKDWKPQGVWPLIRYLKERAIYYREDIEEGGSGGSTHILTAWESIPNGYIMIEQHTQAEGMSSPNYSLAWKVIDSIGLSRAIK